MSRAEGHKGPRILPDPLDLAFFSLGEYWKWLAVLPAETDVDVSDVALSLCSAGVAFTPRRLEFLNAGNLHSEAEAARLLTGLRREEKKPEVGRLVSLASPLVSRAALLVARAADAVVLCTRRGLTPIAAANATVEAVGRQKILCALLFTEKGRKGGRR